MKHVGLAAVLDLPLRREHRHKFVLVIVAGEALVDVLEGLRRREIGICVGIQTDRVYRRRAPARRRGPVYGSSVPRNANLPCPTPLDVGAPTLVLRYYGCGRSARA